MTNNQFIKISSEELEALRPYRGKYSPAYAYLDLKTLLYSCFKARTDKHEGKFIKLEKWEKIISLGFLDNRWKWRDKVRVKRFLEKWEKKGYIKQTFGKNKSFRKIRLTIVGTTPSTTPLTTLNSIDNQGVMSSDVTPPTTPTSHTSTTNIRSKELFTTTTLEKTENLENEGISLKKTALDAEPLKALNCLPYMGKAVEMKRFIRENQLARNTIKGVMDNKKVNLSTPQVNMEVDKWAAYNHENQLFLNNEVAQNFPSFHRWFTNIRKPIRKAKNRKQQAGPEIYKPL